MKRLRVCASWVASSFKVRRSQFVLVTVYRLAILWLLRDVNVREVAVKLHSVPRIVVPSPRLNSGFLTG